jgi:isochorismate synthase EntC
LHTCHFHNTNYLRGNRNFSFPKNDQLTGREKGAFSEDEDSITPSDFTNFLEDGALLRHTDPSGERWHLVWGPFETSATPFSEGISVFCPDFYDLDSAAYRRGIRSQSLSATEVKTQLEVFLHGAPQAELQEKWSEPQFGDFQVSFDSIQKKIHEGEISKAVPVVFRRSPGKVSTTARARILQSLLQAPPSLYVYGFWNANEGILGATPETLFVQEKGHLKTMALAGTLPKNAEKPEKSEKQGLSLMEDPKERSEHNLVVQDIEEILSSYGLVHKEGPKLLELPTLWHLKTDFQVEMKKISPANLIRALHPTPALGVFPRRAGYKWMKELPGQEGRARFGAPFAFLWQDRSVCLVAIRNLQWNEKEKMIGSGCGLVRESRVDREWEELFQKRQSVVKILGLENAKH